MRDKFFGLIGAFGFVLCASSIVVIAGCSSGTSVPVLVPCSVVTACVLTKDFIPGCEAGSLQKGVCAGTNCGCKAVTSGGCECER